MDRAAKVLAILSHGEIRQDDARILVVGAIIALLIVGAFATVLSLVD